MKIGIYSTQLKKAITQSVFNMLIVSEMSRSVEAGGLLAFSAEPLPELSFLDLSVPVIRSKSRFLGFWGSAGERSFILPKLFRKAQIQALVVFEVKDVFRGAVKQFLVLKDQYRYQEKDKAAFRRVKGIIVSSVPLKEYLLDKAAVAAEKIIVLPGLLRPGLKPAAISAIMAFKTAFTEGTEFFICNEAYWTKEKLRLILKAFSRFKKMQQTSWKLLITQRGEDPQTPFGPVFEALKNYRYKDDVVLFRSTGNEQYAQALSAAYMAISLQDGEGYPAAMMEALCCGPPVIVPQRLQNSAGFSLPAYSENDEESLGKKMMEQYKNEGLRHTYVTALNEQPVVINTENNRIRLLKYLLPA